MRDQIVTLEYESYRVIPVGIPIPVFIFLSGYSINDKIAAVIAVQPANDIKKRRLSRTARPQDGNKFVISQIQAHSVQSFLDKSSGAVFFTDVFYLKHYCISFQNSSVRFRPNPQC